MPILTTKKLQANSKPYSKLKIAFSYLFYYLNASNRHSVHSPFVYGFCTSALEKAHRLNFSSVEEVRRKFIKSKESIYFVDYGKDGNTIHKSIAIIASKSLKSKKYARLLAQSVAYFNSQSILEIGTSLGVTTAYLAKSTKGKVHTLEGDSQVAALANQGWATCGLSNITQTVGNFDNTLEIALQLATYDFIYVDGNHRFEPTLRYFELCLKQATADCVFVFDDIHYSKEMETAWQTIKQHPKVQATIDVFFLGYVFISPAITNQHYVLRF